MMASRLSRFLMGVLAVHFTLDVVHLVATLLGVAQDNAFDRVLHLVTYGLSFVVIVAGLVFAYVRGGLRTLSLALAGALVVVPPLYAVLLWFTQGGNRAAPTNWLNLPVLIPVAQLLVLASAARWPLMYVATALLLGVSLARAPRRAVLAQSVALVGCLAACLWIKPVLDFIFD
jgi:hypothetical protein